MKRLHGPIAPEERGALLEGWILHLLRAHNEQRELFEELQYWEPHPGNRTGVDFLLRRGGEFVAVEVKWKARYHAGMLPGLRAIADLPGMARRVLVYGGTRTFRTADGIDVWSIEQLRLSLAKPTLWPRGTKMRPEGPALHRLRIRGEPS